MKRASEARFEITMPLAFLQSKKLEAKLAAKHRPLGVNFVNNQTTVSTSTFESVDGKLTFAIDALKPVGQRLRITGKSSKAFNPFKRLLKSLLS